MTRTFTILNARHANLRAHVERFIQTLKVECLDKFVIVAERRLNYDTREWAAPLQP
jgi:hypothetical protein